MKNATLYELYQNGIKKGNTVFVADPTNIVATKTSGNPAKLAIGGSLLYPVDIDNLPAVTIGSIELGKKIGELIADQSKILAYDVDRKNVFFLSFTKTDSFSALITIGGY